MIQIGDFNKLQVVRIAEIGYYLDGGTGNTSDDILLPNKSALNAELNIGDQVDAFIYRDSKDRIIATLKKPLAKVGDLAYLKVVSTTKIGSFVNFGLERDIFVPFREKVYALQNDKYYLFYIYLDKTGRLAATTDIEKHLQNPKGFKIGDHTTGTVYGFQTNGSVKVAVNNLYKGVILHNEYFNELKHGDVIELTINKFYEDGRIGVTPRKSSREEVVSLQDTILDYLKTHDGFMTFNDKTSPENIYNTFHVSKNHFKNALGGLMKKNLIVQDSTGTRLR